MKYYIIAGEASGDLHGSNLIKALKKEDAQAQVRCWGGDLMQAAGGTLAKHYKELAFMGFMEVLLNLGTIVQNIRFCKKDIAQFAPDVVIFIDYSGFNLKIAKWAKKTGFRTNYYISPQVWASRAGRVEKIKRDIDAMYVILPFEKAFYRARGYNVTFVGHPLIDAIAQQRETSRDDFVEQHGLHPEKPIIALLPGSRKQEVAKMLEGMLSLVPRFPEHQFVIAGAPSLEADFYRQLTKNAGVRFIDNQTYSLLGHAQAALVTSGTATLETALFMVPQVVCYKAHWLSYQIARRIITLRFISLVNLIMDREVVKELVQNDFTEENLYRELSKIIHGPERGHMLEAYAALRQKLGGTGASNKAAHHIYTSLKGS
ncbi:lipid-A-disaccharide synthase [Maribacter sp. 2307ULW6-5]|uniref:lipid-A-disaccharide synthase n=1 Tax=Maribacter sp. 2307ULW6-5 TaxID=3386275 RepID=UPI0039BC3693